MYREWLVEAMAKTKRSQADLVRATGISASVINRMVLGTRALRDTEIVQLSKALGVLPPVTPSGKRAEVDGVAHPIAMEIVPVVAMAQDGSWREKTTPPPKPSLTELPIPAGSDYSGLREAVQVVAAAGHDADVAREHVIYVPIARLGRKLRDGACVYAEISRDGFIQPTILKVMAGAGDITGYRQESAGKTWRAEQVKVIGYVCGRLIEYR